MQHSPGRRFRKCWLLHIDQYRRPLISAYLTDFLLPFIGAQQHLAAINFLEGSSICIRTWGLGTAGRSPGLNAASSNEASVTMSCGDDVPLSASSMPACLTKVNKATAGVDIPDPESGRSRTATIGAPERHDNLTPLNVAVDPQFCVGSWVGDKRKRRMCEDTQVATQHVV